MELDTANPAAGRWPRPELETEVAVVERDADGELRFAGTSVAVHSLFNYLQSGRTVGRFLADFPQVTSDQVADFLEMAKVTMTAPEPSHS